MRKVLVDGNNVVAALGLERGSTAGAEAFLQRLETAAASKDWEAIVVFDGPERFLRREAGPLVVRYAPPGVSADTLIERAVYETADRLSTIVVTQDHAQSDLVRGLGAVVWTPRRLLEEMW